MILDQSQHDGECGGSHGANADEVGATAPVTDPSPVDEGGDEDHGRYTKKTTLARGGGGEGRRVSAPGGRADALSA